MSEIITGIFTIVGILVGGFLTHFLEKNRRIETGVHEAKRVKYAELLGLARNAITSVDFQTITQINLIGSEVILLASPELTECVSSYTDTIYGWWVAYQEHDIGVTLRQEQQGELIELINQMQIAMKKELGI